MFGIFLLSLRVSRFLLGCIEKLGNLFLVEKTKNNQALHYIFFFVPQKRMPLQSLLRTTLTQPLLEVTKYNLLVSFFVFK